VIVLQNVLLILIEKKSLQIGQQMKF